MTENKKFNTMNKDIMPLDSREGNEYDRRNASHKLLFKLDIRVEPEYDTERVLSHEYDTERARKSEYDTERALSHEYDTERVLSHEYDTERALSHEYDNLSSSSCHSRAQTRESRGHECRFAECGRSMVEMLGTLAIIGVLSIGGIMGYSYGMDKYRANETINDINLRGIDLVRQVSMGQAPSLTEWETKSRAGYTFSDAQLSAEGDAYFAVSGVPKRVCEMIYKGIQNNQTTDVEVNEATNGDASDCHKDDDNVMGFFFITNAGEGGSVDELCKDVTCKEGYSCTHGICMSEELPQKASDWKVCSSNNACGICEQCIDKWNDKYCDKLADGTSCGTGKECQLGQCVENQVPIITEISEIPTSDILGICTDNSECESNYYCGHLYDRYNSYDILDIKTCIFAEFHKVPLPDGDYFYVSQHKNITEDAEAMCSSIGMTFIENFTDRMDVIEGLKAFSTEYSGIEVSSKNQSCAVYRSRYECGTQYNSKHYIVCVK